MTLSSSDRRFIDVNDAFETIVGYRREEVIGRTADDIGIWVDPAQKEEAFRRVSAFGKLRAFEHQFRTKTGEIRIGLVSIEPVRIGMNQSLVVANVDITERKQAEQRLRASEQRYGALFFNSQDAVFLTNAAGRIEAANPAACRMLAMSEEEICRAGREGVLDQTDPRLIPALETRRSSGYAEAELTLIRKDGSRLEAEVHSTLVGEQGQAFVIARDITERKRAEAEREQLSAQLAQAQKMESIGRLAGGVAHDFNNLLTVINGQSKLALDNLENSDLLRQRLQDILEAGERAAGLTRQLLAFSRQQVLESSVLDLNGVVTGMRSMLNPLMGDNVKVILDLSDKALPVFADRHQLEQVIMNLAVNARDAMPDGGCLRIETDVVEWDRTEAVHGETHPGLYAVLVVGDTGLGMNETTKQRIFEPFFTTKEAGVGTGLGLSMVQGIVIQSGGSIEVDTKPSQGTKFKIYLPLRAAPEKMNSGECEPTPERSGGATILVVEDRAAVRKYVAEVLRTYGYEVIEAATAEEAVRQSESTKIHLIVTDVVMPGMNGVELVAKLTKTRPSLKAVFMSGYPDYSGPRLPNGSTFLQKPFSPEELAQKIQAVLS